MGGSFRILLRKESRIESFGPFIDEAAEAFPEGKAAFKLTIALFILGSQEANILHSLQAKQGCASGI
ncbi:MAG: hypothetical protein KDK33_13745 [Leptospiraceae bacterium]|nr:hypothetical protein [Leptospiraceae bacterium]